MNSGPGGRNRAPPEPRIAGSSVAPGQSCAISVFNDSEFVDAISPKTRGYLFAFLAICIFAGQDAITKYLGDRYPALFITMIRF